MENWKLSFTKILNKKKSHDNRVNTLLKIGNGVILTASDDKLKIRKKYNYYLVLILNILFY